MLCGVFEKLWKFRTKECLFIFFIQFNKIVVEYHHDE